MITSVLAQANIITLINQVRTTQLTEDKRLDEIAKIRCKFMEERSHKSFFTLAVPLMQAEGYRLLGENLAFDFPDATSTFQALQNSKTHRENNENENYKRVGYTQCKNRVGNTQVILFGDYKTLKN